MRAEHNNSAKFDVHLGIISRNDPGSIPQWPEARGFSVESCIVPLGPFVQQFAFLRCCIHESTMITNATDNFNALLPMCPFVFDISICMI
eukprot:CAMPEP_0185776574 /NCGR_PEP_ID=MMETSP1174-20130828/86210_1 /TAXON_ID=35687 /ORGANISM="Dictyocha speculum, Strain CCMP1381" /LENGTH=89 /DNA_ID=CAMNT_0028464585 /DNA_START=257 /DNA_END=526 /DNA_ORIENTATION=+